MNSNGSLLINGVGDVHVHAVRVPDSVPVVRVGTTEESGARRAADWCVDEEISQLGSAFLEKSPVEPNMNV